MCLFAALLASGEILERYPARGDLIAADDGQIPDAFAVGILKLLAELGCENTPIIPVYNKCDKPGVIPDEISEPGAVRISALTGEGFEEMLDAVSKALPPTRARVKMLIPYSQGAAAAVLRKDGTVHSEEYSENGLLLDITAGVELIDRYMDFCV